MFSFVIHVTFLRTITSRQESKSYYELVASGVSYKPEQSLKFSRSINDSKCHNPMLITSSCFFNNLTHSCFMRNLKYKPKYMGSFKLRGHSFNLYWCTHCWENCSTYSYPLMSKHTHDAHKLFLILCSTPSVRKHLSEKWTKMGVSRTKIRLGTLISSTSIFGRREYFLDCVFLNLHWCLAQIATYWIMAM